MRSSRVLALCLGLFAANAGAQSTTDYDDDNDNLIDIRTLAQLNAVRYDLDGNGTGSAGLFHNCGGTPANCVTSGQPQRRPGRHLAGPRVDEGAGLTRPTRPASSLGPRDKRPLPGAVVPKAGRFFG